jgi:hypothetical protein
MTENTGWVLRPNITYLRADGITQIQTAGWNGIFSFPLMNSIAAGASTAYWTGFNSDWTGAANCSSGSPWNTINALTNGIYGLTDQTGTGALYNFVLLTNGCNNSYKLVCVEQ